MMSSSYEGSLIQFLKEHATSSLLSDFTICSGDKQEFKCSRLILAARSKYYEALFRQEPSRTRSELDLDGWLVGTLLNSLVTPQLDDCSVEDLLQVLGAADFLQMHELLAIIEADLVKQLSLDNIYEVTDSTERFIPNLTILKDEVGKLIKENILWLDLKIISKVWLDASLSTPLTNVKDKVGRYLDVVESELKVCEVLSDFPDQEWNFSEVSKCLILAGLKMITNHLDNSKGKTMPEFTENISSLLEDRAKLRFLLTKFEKDPTVRSAELLVPRGSKTEVFGTAGFGRGGRGRGRHGLGIPDSPDGIGRGLSTQADTGYQGILVPKVYKSEYFGNVRYGSAMCVSRGFGGLYKGRNDDTTPHWYQEVMTSSKKVWSVTGDIRKIFVKEGNVGDRKIVRWIRFLTSQGALVGPEGTEECTEADLALLNEHSTVFVIPEGQHIKDVILRCGSYINQIGFQTNKGVQFGPVPANGTGVMGIIIFKSQNVGFNKHYYLKEITGATFSDQEGSPFIAMLQFKFALVTSSETIQLREDANIEEHGKQEDSPGSTPSGRGTPDCGCNWDCGGGCGTPPYSAPSPIKLDF